MKGLSSLPKYAPRSVRGQGGGARRALAADPHIRFEPGLGGFFLPVVFGAALQATGIWTTCWALFFVLSLVSLATLGREPVEAGPAPAPRGAQAARRESPSGTLREV